MSDRLPLEIHNGTFRSDQERTAWILIAVCVVYSLWSGWHFALFGRFDPLAIDFRVFFRAANSPIEELYRTGTKHPFVYPPSALLFFKPLSLLSLAPGFLVWTVLSLVAYVLAVRRAAGLTVALISPASMAALSGALMGQTSLILSALILAAFTLPSLACGLLLGVVLSIKPQLVVLAPLALLVRRDWRALAGLGLAVMACVAAELILFGPELWIAWAKALPHFAATVERIGLTKQIVSPIGIAESAGLPLLPLLLLGVLFGGASLLALARQAEGPYLAALLVATSLCATPYALPHDMVAIIPACVLIMTQWPVLAALPFLSVFAAIWPGVGMIAGLFGIVAWRAAITGGQLRAAGNRREVAASPRLDWADVMAALLLGFALAARIVISAPYIFHHSGAGEATRVAIAFAQQGTIADAYFDGQGPTAHLMPAMPVIAGTIYRLLGVATPSANVALLLWAVLQVAAAYTLTYLVFRRLGFSKLTRALGALLLSIPIFSSTEIYGFRFWDGALCVTLVSSALLIMAAKRDTLTSRENVSMAAIGAIVTFINPVVGIGLFACIGLYCWNFGLAQFRRAVLVGGILSALLLTPWVVRNQVQLGHPVLRSNFWLEVRMANNSDAIAPADPQRAYLKRMSDIHPYKSLAAQQQVREIGEVAYNAKMKSEALDWISRNPGTFAFLSLRHLRDFFFPPAWTYDFWEKAPIRKLASFMMPSVNFLGLLWLLIGARSRRPLFRPILAFVCVVALPYTLVQPLPRYAYVIYPLLIFLAADLIARSVTAITRLTSGSVGPARMACQDN